MSYAGSETAESTQLPKHPGAADDDRAHELARRMEREHPRWIVMFGTFTRQFICFPRFSAAPGTIVVAAYSDALPARMTYAERTCRLRETGGVSHA